jgi:hypothetical protein
MDDRMAVLGTIESAERAWPTCECGFPMHAVVRAGALWLQCSDQSRPQGGRVARALSLITAQPHSRRLLLDRTELRAA